MKFAIISRDTINSIIPSVSLVSIRGLGLLLFLVANLSMSNRLEDADFVNLVFILALLNLGSMIARHANDLFLPKVISTEKIQPVLLFLPCVLSAIMGITIFPFILKGDFLLSLVFFLTIVVHSLNQTFSIAVYTLKKPKTAATYSGFVPEAITFLSVIIFNIDSVEGFLSFYCLGLAISCLCFSLNVISFDLSSFEYEDYFKLINSGRRKILIVLLLYVVGNLEYYFLPLFDSTSKLAFYAICLKFFSAVNLFSIIPRFLYGRSFVDHNKNKEFSLLRNSLNQCSNVMAWLSIVSFIAINFIFYYVVVNMGLLGGEYLPIIAIWVSFGFAINIFFGPLIFFYNITTDSKGMTLFLIIFLLIKSLIYFYVSLMNNLELFVIVSAVSIVSLNIYMKYLINLYFKSQIKL